MMGLAVADGRVCVSEWHWGVLVFPEVPWPVAGFCATPVEGTMGMTVNFTD